MSAIHRVKYADYTLSPEQIDGLASEFYGRQVALTIIEEHQTAYEFDPVAMDPQIADLKVLAMIGDHQSMSAIMCRNEFKRILSEGFAKTA